VDKSVTKVTIPVTAPGRPAASRPGGPREGVTFEEVLRQEVGKLSFSAHAVRRLEAGRIHLSEEQVRQVSRAVEKAAGKGARESLILLDDLALVVSIKNRTVITAVDRSRMKERVFTNIDSAVIVDTKES